MTSFRRIYALLCAHGHSTEKSIEIILDAKRGDKFALSWIRIIRAESAASDKARS